MGIGKTERNTVQRVADLGIFREFMTSVRRNAANLSAGILLNMRIMLFLTASAVSFGVLTASRISIRPLFRAR